MTDKDRHFNSKQLEKLSRRFEEAAKADDITEISPIFSVHENNRGLFSMDEALMLAATWWLPAAVEELIQMSRSRLTTRFSREELNTALLATTSWRSGKTKTVDDLKQTIHILIKAGADVYAREQYTGHTILHCAFRLGMKPYQATMIQYLLEPTIGALPGLADTLGRIPIFVAAQKANKEALCCLLPATGTLNGLRDNQGNTPFHLAKDRKNAEVLFEWGCDIRAENQRRESVLHLCCSRGDKEMVIYILNLLAILSSSSGHLFEWNLQDPSSSITARRAINGVLRNMDESKIGKVDTGLINNRNDRGMTPLLCARQIQVIELLWNKGASLTAQTNLGWTALHCAVDRCDDRCEDPVVDFILDHLTGDDLAIALRARAKTYPGRDSLDESLVDENLLDEDLPDRTDSTKMTENETPLHWAVVRSHSVVKKLLDKAEKLSILNEVLEATDSNGATPLIRAIMDHQYGIRGTRQPIIRTLVAWGASLDVKVDGLVTARALAEEKGYDISGVVARS